MNVRIAQSPIHGLGVFANEPIKKDHWQYLYGDLRVVLPGDPVEKYGIEWDETKTFIPFAPFCCCNHSEEPNCEINDIDLDPRGHPMLYITPLRNIEQDEEILINYGYDPSES